MSNVTGGETELAVGDTVQLDKGLHIVECVGNKTADCLPLDDKNGGKPRTVNNPFPRHLVISRGGQPALDEFLGKKSAAAAQPKVKKGFVLLEPGDKLCHGGEMRTVVSVLEKRCIIGNLEGQEFYEDRQVNEFLLLECCTHKYIRLDPAQRAANLEQFLAQRKSPLPEAQTSDETTENESEKPMAKKTKAVEAKSTEERHGALGGWLGNSVTSVIRSLGKSGVSVAHAKAIAKKAGIEVADATVQIQINAGVNGKAAGAKGKAVTYADITAAQIKELKDSCKEPAAESKE